MRSLLVLLIVSALFVPVLAAREMMHPMMMRGQTMMGGSMMYPLCPMMGHSALDTYISYKEELNLSEKQVKDLRALRTAYRKKVTEKNAQLSELQADLDELYEAKRLDYKVISKKVAEIEKLQSELRSFYFDILDKADKILTDEQKEKLITLTKGMKHQMEEKGTLEEHHHMH